MITYSPVGEVVVIAYSNPPVNALSTPGRQALLDAVKRFKADAQARAALLVCDGRTFIVGADIAEFDRPARGTITLDVVEEIESSGKLVVAAMHGSALGGGLEIAMGCHYRCASGETRLGLPEVNLGLIPGAGGTQRLPRLVGLEQAATMMLEGKPVPASEALQLGLVDKIVAGPVRAGGLAYLRELLAQGATPRRVSAMPPAAPDAGSDFFKRMRSSAAFRSTGQRLAPTCILRCLEQAATPDFKGSVALERRLFEECRSSEPSRALRYMFFAKRAATRMPPEAPAAAGGNSRSGSVPKAGNDAEETL